MASLRLVFLHPRNNSNQATGGVFEDPPLDVAQRIGKGLEKKGSQFLLFLGNSTKEFIAILGISKNQLNGSKL